CPDPRHSASEFVSKGAPARHPARAGDRLGPERKSTMNLLALLLTTLAATMTAQAAQAPAPKPPPAHVTPQPNYQIGPQDELKITVFDAYGLTGIYRVGDDGFISFPLLGRISVGGLTLTETQEKVRQLLKNGYIRDPQVRVDIQEYKSQSIFVSGEVR